MKIENLLRGRLAEAMKRGHRLIDTGCRTSIAPRRQHHDAACRFPGQADRFGKDEQGLRLRVAHVLFNDRGRYVRHDGQRRNHFFEPARDGEFLQFSGRQLARTMYRFHQHLGSSVA